MMSQSHNLKKIPSNLPRQRSPITQRKHVLDLDDFSKEEILDLIENTAAMKEVLGRDIKKTPTLRGKTIVTLFFEPSTRTRASFEQAGKALSADVINLSGQNTSAEKGESLYNTALTIQAMKTDFLIIRHPHSGAPYFLARHIDSHIINAGDGSHAHPTQALLDLYTIHSTLGQIKDLSVVIIGDILHSRVARSNLWGLSTMGAEITLCAPPTLMPQDFLDSSHQHKGHPFKSVRIEPNIKQAIKNADVVMSLRLQTERQQSGKLPTLREYSKMYGLTSEHMSLAKPGALVMHPGPMNEGVEISSDVAHGITSVIEDQVTNGVAVRMALLYKLISDTRENGQT